MQSFIGKVNFLRIFIPNFADVITWISQLWLGRLSIFCKGARFAEAPNLAEVSFLSAFWTQAWPSQSFDTVSILMSKSDSHGKPEWPWRWAPKSALGGHSFVPPTQFQHPEPSITSWNLSCNPWPHANPSGGAPGVWASTSEWSNHLPYRIFINAEIWSRDEGPYLGCTSIKFWVA